MKIMGAIFDLDGTLLDSMSIWENVGIYYLQSLNINPREEFAQRYVNMSLYQASCYIKDEYHVDKDVNVIMEEINKMVEKFYFNEVIPKPGAQEFLEKFKSMNVKMCIATATDRYLVEAALERCKILKYFSDIITCTDVGSGKDEPQIYETSLECLETNKEDTIVFEDMLYALKTLNRAGFKTAAVYDSYAREPDKIREIADFYIKDYSRTSFFEEVNNI